MTSYEQAVAQAMLKIVHEQLPMTLWQRVIAYDGPTRIYALRRLRVRAGLNP